MKLSFDALLVIDTIARTGSFSAAAHALHKVPSAITYTVKKLEEDLDIQVFDRRGHRAVLTATGRALLEDGRKLLLANNELEAKLRRINQGIENNICVAVNDFFADKAILAVLDQFYAQGFGTKIKYTREVYGGLWEAIISGRADFVVGAAYSPALNIEYISTPISTIPFIFAVAPHHPLAKIKHALTPEDIKPFRSVAVSDTAQNYPLKSVGILEDQEVLSVPDMYAKAQAHIAGVGVGYLPKPMARHYEKQGKLVIKSVKHHREPVPLSVSWMPQREKTAGPALSWLMHAFSTLEPAHYFDYEAL